MIVSTDGSVGINSDTFTQSRALVTSGIIISTGGAMQTTGLGYGTTAGGIRGLGAVDLQTNRSLVDQIAGSNYSVISGGGYNKAAGFYSAVGGGSSNSATNGFSVVSGGQNNSAAGYNSAVGGGANNSADGDSAAVSGGNGNSAGGIYSVIGGGYLNQSTGSYSVVGGGYLNLSTGAYSVAGGGYQNVSTNTYTFVGGGAYNKAGNVYAAIAGGDTNYGYGNNSFIGSGSSNKVFGNWGAIGSGNMNFITYNGAYSFIGGGQVNTAVGPNGAIGGGQNNMVGNTAVVAGGQFNTALGQYSAIPGGSDNSAAANYSFAAGRLSSSTAIGAFTWNDSQGAPVDNTMMDRVWFKSRGGFMVTTSTKPSDGGFFVQQMPGSSSLTARVDGDLSLGDTSESGNTPVTIWLRNNSGSVRTYGEIVIIDPSIDNAFTCTTTSSDTAVIGVVYEPTINPSAVGRIAIHGVVKIRTAIPVTKGQLVVTHTTSCQAAVTGSAVSGASIGKWLQSTGSGGGALMDAVLLSN
jgi:hypothetical protein